MKKIMTKIRVKKYIARLIILAPLYLLSDYLAPIHWGEIKVSGQACTCPNYWVDNGSFYLQYITPDSLKKEDISYNEINIDYKSINEPGAEWFDNYYLIKGNVVGIQNSDTPIFNPVFKVTSYRKVNIGLDYVIKFLYAVLFCIWFVYESGLEKEEEMASTRLNKEI